MPTFARRPKRLLHNLGMGVLALLPGCIDPTQAAAPASSSGTSAEFNVAVLPNNTTIHAGTNRIIALRTDGEIVWELTLPDRDTIIAPVAVALNSVTYVRGTRALHAAKPDGKWLWSKALEGRSFTKSRAADSPVAMSDSTVAVVIGNDIVRFDHAGAVRWRISLPEGHVSARLAAGMDGSLVASTTAGIYSLSPDGQVTWRRVLGQ